MGPWFLSALNKSVWTVRGQGSMIALGVGVEGSKERRRDSQGGARAGEGSVHSNCGKGEQSQSVFICSLLHFYQSSFLYMQDFI